MDVSQMSIGRVEALGSLPSAAPQLAEAQAAQQVAQTRSREQARQETRQVAAAVQQLNDSGYSGPTRELTILLDPKTHRPMVRIVDKETGEVLQQIPPEYVLRIAQEAKERLRDG